MAQTTNNLLSQAKVEKEKYKWARMKIYNLLVCERMLYYYSKAKPLQLSDN